MDALFRLAYRTAYQGLRLWWRLARPCAQGAAVAVWHDGRLLVVRTAYRAALDLPGGGAGRGEPLRAAALRELHEETGLCPAPDALEDAGAHVFVEHHRRITMRVFVWRPPAPPAPIVDRREIVWAGYLAPRELAREPLTEGLRRYLAGRA